MDTTERGRRLRQRVLDENLGDRSPGRHRYAALPNQHQLQELNFDLEYGDEGGLGYEMQELRTGDSSGGGSGDGITDFSSFARDPDFAPYDT